MKLAILLYSKKGKRKITVNGKTYFWCVTIDKEMGNTGIMPVFLRVFSESEYLFGVPFEWQNKRWEPFECSSGTGHTLLGEPPIITPHIVKEHILGFLDERIK